MTEKNLTAVRKVILTEMSQYNDRVNKFKSKKNPSIEKAFDLERLIGKIYGMAESIRWAGTDAACEQDLKTGDFVKLYLDGKEYPVSESGRKADV